MKQQNYSNHRKLSFSFHILTLLAILSVMGGMIYYIVTSKDSSQLLSYLLLALVFCLISVALHARSFALKAQDRAIRAEENLRYFILTGKRLNQALTIRQIIALRFAEDQEFLELTEKTIKENLSPTQIKESIKNWRPDHHRA